MPPAEGPCYVVHALDKPGSAELRSATRDAHLRWLAESGRCRRAGPLGPSGGGDDRVGSLLFVNADSADELSTWLDDDPYARAGLFQSVTIAPMLELGVPRDDDDEWDGGAEPVGTLEDPIDAPAL